MKKIALAVASVLLVSGCATPGQDGSQGQNAAAGAAIGALLGCAIASATGGKCATGALIGSAVGGFAGWSYQSKKVASANNVNAQARREGVNVPDHIEVRDYSVAPNSFTVTRGTTLITESHITLIGNTSNVPKVEESLILVRPDGKESKPQIAQVQHVDGAGGYESTGKYPLNQGFEQGLYTIKTTLSLDGQVVRNSQFNVQVAIVDGNQVVRLASAE